MELYFAIIEQIEQANLPSTVNLTARRFLDRAIRTGGHLVLSHTETMAICGTTKKATMRSHLVQLGRAEIIHYSTNASIYVTFVAIAERAQMIAQRSQANEDSPQTNDLRALSARNDRSAITDDRSAREMIAQTSNLIAQRANDAADTIYPPAGAPELIDWLNNPPSMKKDNSINPASSGSQPGPPPLTGDQRRTMSLLADPEVLVVQASVREEIARSTSFEEVRRQVAYWSRGNNRPGTDAGFLVKAIRAKHPTPDIPADFRRTELYQRHLTPAEIEAEAAAQAALDATPAEEPTVVPPAGGPDPATMDELTALWESVQQAVRGLLPPGVDYLYGARLTRAGPVARIEHPASTQHLLPRLERKLLSALRHCGAEVESIEFVANRSEL